MPTAGVGFPSGALVGGNSVRNPILEGYVFQSGIHKPEHSNILSYKYPQYYLTTLLDRLGASEGTAQKVFSWNIMDRTRASSDDGGVIATLTATGSPTITFDTTFPYTSTNLGYLIVGDVIRLETGVLGRVSAVADAGGAVQEVTVQKVGGGNWGASDIADGMAWGHSHTMFPEASSAPNGRLYLPTEDYNVLTILRRSLSISGSEFTNRTWLGDGSAWYFTQEDLEMKEFAKDRENLIIFGDLDTEDIATGLNGSRGLLDWVNSEGVTNGYAKAVGVSESDIQSHIKELMIEGASNELFVLCGADFLEQVQTALRDYAIAGAMNYGRLGDNTAGLDFVSYYFLGKTIHFAYYELFNDVKIVPFSGTPTATKIDFSDFSLWLDLGTDSSGRSLITLKHKELNGKSRKFIHAYKNGMMGPEGQVGGSVPSGDDKFEIFYLSDIGLEVRLANRMGILRATS
jgi:hypothetical protein